MTRPKFQFSLKTLLLLTPIASGVLFFQVYLYQHPSPLPGLLAINYLFISIFGYWFSNYTLDHCKSENLSYLLFIIALASVLGGIASALLLLYELTKIFTTRY
jgi:hypothetical protein